MPHHLQKAATDFKRNKQLDCAIACLSKSNEISDSCARTPLQEKDYLRLPKYIKLSGNEILAEQTELAIYAKHPEFKDKRISNLKGIQNTLRSCHQYKNDLVHVITNDTCPICRNYNDKVYSINGNSKLYPKLPKELFQNGGFCPDCFISMTIYFEGISSPPK